MPINYQRAINGYYNFLDTSIRNELILFCQTYKIISFIQPGFVEHLRKILNNSNKKHI